MLFFVVADLALIDPMYQFSLLYFSRLFNQVIETCPANDDLVIRIESLLSQITEAVFLNVCRGLFNNHKRIFSFMVAAQIDLKSGRIIPLEWD